jgi:hypothetical protein
LHCKYRDLKANIATKEKCFFYESYLPYFKSHTILLAIMKQPVLLLGDQIESSIRLCTQNIGLLFGFKGARIDNKALHLRDLHELNLLTPPFLYYLTKSGLEVSSQIFDSLIDALVLFRSSNGSFDNHKFSLKKQRGDVMDTSLSTLNLLKISQQSKQNQQTEIYEAVNWLKINVLPIVKKKNEINVDSLLAFYCILQVAGNYEDRNLIRDTVSTLTPLKFITDIKSVTSNNKYIESEVLFPLAVRMLIEIALLTNHEQFFTLAEKTLETQINQYKDLINFLIEGKSSFFGTKKVHLGKCSLWAYDCLQLYQYSKVPELLEIANSLLRLVSDVIIQSHSDKSKFIPEYFDIKTGTYSKSTSINSIRFYLDAAELSKKFNGATKQFSSIEENSPSQLITLKTLRQEV